MRAVNFTRFTGPHQQPPQPPKKHCFKICELNCSSVLQIRTNNPPKLSVKLCTVYLFSLYHFIIVQKCRLYTQATDMQEMIRKKCNHDCSHGYIAIINVIVIAQFNFRCYCNHNLQILSYCYRNRLHTDVIATILAVFLRYLRLTMCMCWYTYRCVSRGEGVQFRASVQVGRRSSFG